MNLHGIIEIYKKKKKERSNLNIFCSFILLHIVHFQKAEGFNHLFVGIPFFNLCNTPLLKAI